MVLWELGMMFSTTLAFYYYYYATMLHLVFWGLSLAPSLRPSPMLSLAVSLESYDRWYWYYHLSQLPAASGARPYIFLVFFFGEYRILNTVLTL
jgi:hypothetical protein